MPYYLCNTARMSASEDFFARPPSRHHQIVGAGPLRVALFYYQPGEHHPAHVHTHAQLSFLLAGSFAELSHGGEQTPLGPHHRFHPSGARHSVHFGRRGALLLTIDLAQNPTQAPTAHSWQPSGKSVSDHVRLLLANIVSAADAADGLLAAACIGASNEKDRGHVPRWLSSAVEHLADDPAVPISQVAVAAGVHRAYLARCFQRHFGVTPVQFRLYCKCSAALMHMVEHGESPAAAAHAAGFADQAHWTRASRAISGIGPGRISRLLAA